MQRTAAIQSLGVKKGDRVLIYMPMIAEAAFAMLACTRIGAIHSVVFGGFASQPGQPHRRRPAHRDRQRRRRQPRGGKVVPHKHLLDEAINLAGPQARQGVDGQPRSGGLRRSTGRDVDHAEQRALQMDTRCRASGGIRPTRATSCTPGTTGTPKGVQRDTAATPSRWRRR